MITAACARRLGLPMKLCNAPLILAGGSRSAAPGVTACELSSLTSDYVVSIEAHVMPVITTSTPSRHLHPRDLPRVTLADPSFCVPGEIDMLLGNGLFLSLLSDGRHKVGKLVLQNTQLGWILGGELPSASHQPNNEAAAVTHAKLSEVVARFWEIEGYDTPALPPADRACEAHFHDHVNRNRDGRFVVALPFRESPDRLGNSSAAARGSFLSLEKRLLRHPEVHEKYKAFMQEYVDLGHMSLHDDDVHNGYYLPHHCVIKEASLTTKLRVVFNASAPTDTGVSLNELLMSGPKQQDELFIIMMRMRCHRFVITADITKMYRQVLVRPEDTRYQRIWWRNEPTEQLRSYELQTVTYGIAPALYLAIKALRETAVAAAQQYPIGAEKCLADFYVDDLFTGANTEHELAIIRDQVQAVLETGGFRLNKWASNSSSVLAHLDQEQRQTDVIIHDWAATINALGMKWNPKDDVLSYNFGAAAAVKSARFLIQWDSSDQS